MKITTLAGYFVPEQSADTHLNDDLVRDFSDLGAQVKVIVPFPSRGVTSDQVKKYISLPREIINENLVIQRVGKPNTFYKDLIRRGFSFLGKTMKLYFESKKEVPDCYFIVSTPPFLGYIGILLARKAPVVYKLQDVFPDNLIEMKGWKENKLLVKILRCLERKVYKSVDRILVCSEDVKNTLVRKNVDKEKIVVIHDWIDENACVPIEKEKNPLFEKFDLDKEKFIFLYAGNLGYLQNIDTILDASKIIQSQYENIQVVIVGDGARKDHIKERIRQENIANVKLFPIQPLSMVSYVYSLGNVGLVSLKPGVSKTALPSKTWSILSAERPVLCEIDLDCELAKIVEKEKCGFCASPNDAENMAKQMITMYEMGTKLMHNMGFNGRRYVSESLNRKLSTQKCFNVIKDLCMEENKNVII